MNFASLRKQPVSSRWWLGSLCIAFLLMAVISHAAPAEWNPRYMLQSQQMPLLPYLDYYIDESLSMDIEEAADPARANAYQPLILENLPRLEGITWLRFSIAAQPLDSRQATFLLDMGQSIPGTPVLYDSARNELSGALEWRENIPAQRNILLLPEAGPETMVCYIRLEGLPGPWFAPMIRTPQNAASNWSSLSRTGAILALGVVMLLCLLRGLSENGQWRIWTALYVGVALAQALAGMPTVGINAGPGMLCAVLTPGIALMLLPHVGRHLMRTPQFSRLLDIQLLLLSVPGAILALLPLVPGWSWLDRWLDLWPAGTILFIPTALGAWFSGLAGSRRFLLGCILPPIFVSVAWFGLDFGLPPNLLASAPLWGIALSALLIAATRAPWNMKVESQNVKAPPVQIVENVTTEAPQETIINLDNPLEDPNLQLVDTPLANIKLAENTETPPDNLKDTGNAIWSAREDAIRVQLDDILREGAALDQCSLAPAARRYAEKMVTAGKRIAEMLSSGVYDNHNVIADNENRTFNLQRIIRNAHDSAATLAEASGTSLSWYMPPHLCQIYTGNVTGLENVLHLLLESSLRAAPRGAVHISARRVPDSAETGHILFTVTDNGTGIPPLGRSTLALVRAWELAGRNGGFLGMESGTHGVTISFSMHFAAAPEDESLEAGANMLPHVILASEDGEALEALAKIVGQTPCRTSMAANMHEALVCQSMDPASLLVAHGRLAMPTASEMAREFSKLAREAGFTRCYILAITQDDSQWNQLKSGGFTHAMIEPVDADTLQQTVAELLQKANAFVSAESTDAETVQPETTGEKTDKTVSINEAGNAEGEKAIVPENGKNSELLDLKEIIEPVNSPSAVDNSETSGVSDNLEDIKNNGAERKLQVETNAAYASQDDIHEVITIHEDDKIVDLPDLASKNTTPEVVQKTDSALIEQSGTENMSPQITLSSVPETLSMPDDTKNSDILPEARFHKEDSIMDFIVGVEETERAANGGNVKPAEPEHPDDKPQGNVVASSEAIKTPILQEGNTVSLPGAHNVKGINETEENDVDPVISGLVDRIDSAMADAMDAFSRQNGPDVAIATGKIAVEAEGFGLRLLGRMARCVERAARANDHGALGDLLPELSVAVERNRLTLTQKRPGKASRN